MSRLRYPFTEISARCRLCGAEGLTASSEHALGGRLIDWRRSHALVCPEWPRWAEKKGLRLDERGALLYPNETGPYAPRLRPKADDDVDLDDDEAETSETTEAPAASEPTAPPDEELSPSPAFAASLTLDLSATPSSEAPPSRGATPVTGRPHGSEESSTGLEPTPVSVAAESVTADFASIVPIAADGHPSESLNPDELIAAPAAPARRATRTRAAEQPQPSVAPTVPEVVVPPPPPRIDLMAVPAEDLQQAELF
jgi:hypothetical protein